MPTKIRFLRTWAISRAALPRMPLLSNLGSSIGTGSCSFGDLQTGGLLCVEGSHVNSGLPCCRVKFLPPFLVQSQCENYGSLGYGLSRNSEYHLEVQVSMPHKERRVRKVCAWYAYFQPDYDFFEKTLNASSCRRFRSCVDKSDLFSSLASNGSFRASCRLLSSLVEPRANSNHFLLARCSSQLAHDVQVERYGRMQENSGEVGDVVRCGEAFQECGDSQPDIPVLDVNSGKDGTVVPERRRRGVSSSSRPLSEWRDLLTVPGIGRRNMEKLVAQGIGKLDELKQLYRDKYRTHGSDKMVEFLRSSVGVHKHHANSITDFIKSSVEAEDGNAEVVPVFKKRLTFCVEGNISVGKTTFLHKIASETIELRDLVEVVPEPIAKWQDVGPDHFNILDAFYGNPERYAYTFQNYVFVTRMMQERESAIGKGGCGLWREVFLAIEWYMTLAQRFGKVFVRAVHEAKWMSDAEISIYDSWFDPVVSAMPGLVPDAFIYLRATPDTCHRRLQSRKRKEEDAVTLDYLRDLHEKHEQWLFPAERGGSNKLTVSNWTSEQTLSLPPRLRDRVLYLQGSNVHSSIQKVPALVLDCEPSIDFSRDLEAKAEYARQVADFFQFVQSLKDGTSDASSGQSSLVLPRSHPLVGPDGRILNANTLDSVDLRRHIAAVCR